MRHPRFRSIRAKLVLSLGLPLLASYVALLTVDFVINRRAAVEQMQSVVLERAEGAARVIDSRLSSVAQLSHALTTLAVTNPAERARAVLTEALNDRWVTSATIVVPGVDGTPTAYAARRESRNVGGNNNDRFGPGGPGFGRGRVMFESVPLPAWYGEATNASAGKWRFDSASLPASQRTALYVEPIGAGGRAVGAIALDVSLRAIRTLRPGRPPDGPPDRFRNGAASRPAMSSTSEADAGPTGDPGFQRGGRGGPRDRLSDDRNTPDATLGGPRGSRNDLADVRGDVPPDLAGDTRRDPLQSPSLAGLADARRTSTTQPADELADFAVFDGNGRLVIPASGDDATPADQTIFEVADSVGAPAMAETARQAIAGQSGIVSVAGLGRVITGLADDSDHWLAMSPIPSAGWFLVTAVSESQHVHPVVVRLLQRAMFLAGGLVVMIVVVLLISVRMSRRLERLDVAVEGLASGDLDVPMPPPGPPDEIGRLTRGFARMTRELRERMAALTQQTAAREKVEGELRIARQIQLDLLPKTFPPFPERTEFELHAINEPARQVAGDFYDFFFTPDGSLTIVVADVSGKGVPAALLMAVTRTLVRSLADAGHDPAAIIAGVNRALAQDSATFMFVTMFLCRYAPATGRIRYVNAGHPPPLRLAPGAAPTPFCNLNSPVVGLDDTGVMGDFEQHEERLGPGETMLVYTDGVTDAPGAGKDYLELDGLIDVLRGHGDERPRAVCERLIDVLIRHPETPRRDDTTVLALRRSLDV